MAKTVILFGISLAVLVALLKWVEFMFFTRDLALEAYIGIVGLFFTALLVVIVISFIYKDLDPVEKSKIPAGERPKMSLKMIKPGKELWVIISICLCTYLTEGTIADWSSVYLMDVTHASETIAGRGFAVFHHQW